MSTTDTTQPPTVESRVYADRNAIAIAFATLVHRYRFAMMDAGCSDVAIDYRACWTEPDDEDDADAAEWALVYCWLPEGQVSWHVPRDLAEASDLPKKYADWDGHGRAEKNARLRAFAE